MPRILTLRLLIADDVDIATVTDGLNDCLRDWQAMDTMDLKAPTVGDWAYQGPAIALPDTPEVNDALTEEGGFTAFIPDYQPLED